MSQAGDLDLMLSVSGSKIDVAGGKAAGVISKGKERAPKTIRQVNALMNNSGSRNVVASKKKSSRTGKPNQEVLVEVKAKTVREEALAHKEEKNTNETYPSFFQDIFHAGDEYQFQLYRDATNSDACSDIPSLSENLFEKIPIEVWDKYKSVDADATLNTSLPLKYKISLYSKNNILLLL